MCKICIDEMGKTCSCSSTKNDTGTYVTICNCKYGSDGNLSL